MNFKKVSNFINLSGLIILLLISFDIFGLLFSSRNDLLKADKEQKNLSGFNRQFNVSKKDSNLPDIYYIVLDSYPSYENLRDILGFENEDFMKYLLNKGFFVTKNCRSNYNFTLFSISATLNMDYLQMDKMKNDNFRLKNNQSYFKQTKNSLALSYLESLGYNLFIDSPLLSTRYHDIEFCNSLLMMTIMISPYIQNYVSALLFRGRVLSTLKSLENSLNLKKPVFVYGHIMIPHVPYMFDRYGNMPGFFKQKDFRRMFVEQLLYTNERVKEIVDKILSTSDKRPIVIIQGDHGPDQSIKDKKKRMKIRTGILNAIYLQDETKNIFFDGMTSVNTFRIIFNKYFGTNLELLPDITYYQENERGNMVVYNPK